MRTLIRTTSIYYGDRLGRLWMIYGITTLRDMADKAYRAAEAKGGIRIRDGGRAAVICYRRGD